VAAHLEPEILLVDEVLAVGDINFQKKCLGKMGDVARAGRTVVLVSHQLNQIRKLCHRVVWVDDGAIRLNGDTHEVVSAYESAMRRSESTGEPANRATATKACFLRWEIVDAGEPHILNALGPTTIKFTLRINEAVLRGHHGIALTNHDQQLIWAWATQENLRLETGEHSFCFTFPMLPLRPGPYNWRVGLFEEGNLLDMWECTPEMIVATESHQHASDEWNGILNIPTRFEIL
jgi:lipopolysaccharide transport system ATP-binding protein